MIAVVNYGVGNLKSIVKAVEYVGGKVRVTDNPEIIKEASAVIFPGVGAFKTAIDRLNSMMDVIDTLSVPVLGICLGMQLFATESTEGGLFKGLNYIPGRVVRFPSDVGKVPHMGWNTIKIKRRSEVLDGVESGSYVYFVHSYYMETEDRYVLTETDYGINFVSGVEKENYVGFQFHPEKSGKIGLKILENFVRMAKQ
ncbi:imidazole glycerol phosphate synthase subunit HisH [Archaeoglobus neptunius]|uniref:imidazole glycerol phosphate synthase subunit HisH n=1 Tax=Archaeoglobus neptunius TaxID=2798580 RepID=UPI001928155C|nr:imidazole glycerol phosphate synthase subunit HisH [Archaeoglobus neptunius]